MTSRTAMNVGEKSPPRHSITRRLEIDMGHRIPDHASKCCNLHGHRYVIEAMCTGGLAEAGEQTGMVLDFGFLKRVMVEQIEHVFDHALCLHMADPQLWTVFGVRKQLAGPFPEAVDGKGANRIIVVDRVPTAENLAAIWFDLIRPGVETESTGRAELSFVTVWETPNCWARYPA